MQFGPFLLHSQGKCADIEIVRLLLEANADVNLQDDVFFPFPFPFPSPSPSPSPSLSPPPSSVFLNPYFS